MLTLLIVSRSCIWWLTDIICYGKVWVKVVKSFQCLFSLIVVAIFLFLKHSTFSSWTIRGQDVLSLANLHISSLLWGGFNLALALSRLIMIVSIVRELALVVLIRACFKWCVLLLINQGSRSQDCFCFFSIFAAFFLSFRNFLITFDVHGDVLNLLSIKLAFSHLTCINTVWEVSLWKMSVRIKGAFFFSLFVFVLFSSFISFLILSLSPLIEFIAL